MQPCLLLSADFFKVGYRGEMKRHQGNIDGAKVDLETAVEPRSGRVGAWANLGLLALDGGDTDGAVRALSAIEQRIPHLLREAVRANRLSLDTEHMLSLPPVDVMKPALEWMLAAMLGNRSSGVWTHRDADGRFVVLPDPAPLQAWARAHLDLAETLAT